jgi:hypothetical protein
VLIGKLEHLLVENISGNPVAERDWRKNTHRHTTLQLPSPPVGPHFDHRYPSALN